MNQTNHTKIKIIECVQYLFLGVQTQLRITQLMVFHLFFVYRKRCTTPCMSKKDIVFSLDPSLKRHSHEIVYTPFFGLKSFRDIFRFREDIQLKI